MNTNQMEQLFTDEISVSKDISNNLGEQLIEAKTESKEGKRLKSLSIAIEEAKAILPEFNDADTKEEAQAKLKRVADLLYAPRHALNQMKYTERKSVSEIIVQAYNLVAGKMDARDAMEESLKEI